GVGAAVQPVKQAMSRAASALSGSNQSGRSAGWAATGGQSVVGSTGEAANGSSFAGPLSASHPNSTAGSPPEWANRMKRGQAMSHGASTAAHSIRSGDHGGGSMNVSLHQDDHR
ncbi:P-type conjugative transfer protein TrbL, partial [Mesorhizobium sp. Cs1321R2N1]